MGRDKSLIREKYTSDILCEGFPEKFREKYEIICDHLKINLSFFWNFNDF